MFLQKTICKPVEVKGLGLHKGQAARLNFCPAPINSGVRFIRKDLPGSSILPVSAHLVNATHLATSLGGENFSVSTIEHCLSSLAAFRIDNLFIELEGPEIPIGDGSARIFSEALLKSGIVEQDQPRKYARIRSKISFEKEDQYAYVVPYNGLRISCTIDFPHPVIGRQSLDLDINERSFSEEIASARTFGFEEDIEKLHAQGLALGGSLENAIVVGKKGVLNPEGLRFKDEFVRHKILDALGDLVTLGCPMMGHLVLYKAGHSIMNQLVRKILQQSDSFCTFELGAQIFSDSSSREKN